MSSDIVFPTAKQIYKKLGGGAGYTEKAKTLLTFDGDVTDKHVMEGVAVKVSDEPTDLSKIGLVQIGGDVELTFTNFAVVHLEHISVLVDAVEEIELVYSVSNDSEGMQKGTYVFFSDTNYVARVATAETVHTIDPKYLPSGGVGFISENGELCAEDVEAVENPDTGEYAGVFSKYLDLTHGKTYTVKFDGESYKCVFEDDDGIGFMGNLSVMNPDAPNTGEPFIIMNVSEYGISGMYARELGTHHIAIYGEMVEKIDRKFIPGYCLPVVNLTTQISSTPTDLTPAECEVMDEIAATKLPCIVSVLGDLNIIFSYFTQNGTYGYIARNPNPNNKTMAFILGYNDNQWQAYTGNVY